MILILQCLTDVTVKFQTTSYTVSSQSSNSVLCVTSTSKGTSEEFVIIAETNSTISEVLTISKLVMNLYIVQIQHTSHKVPQHFPLWLTVKIQLKLIATTFQSISRMRVSVTCLDKVVIQYICGHSCLRVTKLTQFQSLRIVLKLWLRYQTNANAHLPHNQTMRQPDRQSHHQTMDRQSHNLTDNQLS